MAKFTAYKNEPWEGFEPHAYTLDLQKTCSLSMTYSIEARSDKEPSEVSTIGEVFFVFLSKEDISEIKEHLYHLEVTTVSGHIYRFGGSSFARDLLMILLRLRKKGINGFEAEWFWYDKDMGTVGNNCDAYSFFIVYNGSIVEEQVALFDRLRDGFDPKIFAQDRHENAAWQSEKYWEEARIAYHYRKFYRETQTGQMMVLRPDEPEIHYSSELRQDLGKILEQGNTKLREVKLRTEWIIIILIGLLILLFIRRI